MLRGTLEKTPSSAGEAPSVPSTDGLARHIVQPHRYRHPCYLMNPVAEHVVVAAHDDAVERICNRTLVALDIEFDAGGYYPRHHCQQW